MTCPVMDDQAIEDVFTAPDFAQACSGTYNDTKCPSDAAATVFRIVSHSLTSCNWSPGRYQCADCLDASLKRYADYLITAKKCSMCHQPVVGTLDTNVRVMPL